VTRAERRILDRLERDLDHARAEGYPWQYRYLLVECAACLLRGQEKMTELGMVRP